MSQPTAESPPRILSVQVGRIAALGDAAGRSVPSGFVKSPVVGAVEAGHLGLSGDQQADLTVHGGPDKAVYFYPAEHYARWVQDTPRHEQALVPGAFGENITTLGLDEDTVSVGQVFRIGGAELQVTQPRQPCFKLGLRFRDNTLGRIMMQTGRTGWYTRVLKIGLLQAGDRIDILHRPNPAWTITRMNGLILDRDRSRREYGQLAGLEGLAEVWKQAAREALEDARET